MMRLDLTFNFRSSLQREIPRLKEWHYQIERTDGNCSSWNCWLDGGRERWQREVQRTLGRIHSLQHHSHHLHRRLTLPTKIHFRRAGLLVRSLQLIKRKPSATQELVSAAVTSIHFQNLYPRSWITAISRRASSNKLRKYR